MTTWAVTCTDSTGRVFRIITEDAEVNQEWIDKQNRGRDMFHRAPIVKWEVDTLK
jgi:hypothetical protein